MTTQIPRDKYRNQLSWAIKYMESLSQLENSSELSCLSVNEWVLHKSSVELTSWALQAEPTLQGRSLLSDSVLQAFNQILVRGRDGNNPS